MNTSCATLQQNQAKSKGQFYTPAEVSRIMAKVIGVSSAKSADQTIYDPTCGSGSLLLKAHDEARSNTGLDLARYMARKTIMRLLPLPK